MGVFSEFAPAYFAAGLPVMPLKKRSKAPILNEWTAYGSTAPSRAVQELWLREYPDSNIGLPFGPASGLCAIDIDTEDEELTAAIMDCLPVSPWHRVGKKGVGLIYRWQGQKNFKIRSDDGMICEFLGLGNQMVMPPSIHPDTGLAYTANADLWEVMSKIQPLGTDIEEKLRAALGVKGFSLAHEGRSAPLIVVPKGERDVQLVRHAGYLARVVLGIDKKSRFGLQEAMQHMHHWVENFTVGAAGDDMDPDKGVAKLLEFLLKDVESGKTLPEGWDSGLTSESLAHPTIQAMLEKNETQRWTVKKASDWINHECGGLGPQDMDVALSKVMELVSLVAADENFSEFEFRALVPHLIRNAKPSGIDFLKTDLIQNFKVERKAPGGAGEDDADHEAIAQRVIEGIQRDGEIRWWQGTFWQWNGSCFGALEEDVIYRYIAENVKGNQLARRHNDYGAVVKTIAVLVKNDLVESLENGVNFANGFLDSSGVLHDHEPKFGCTFTMPFNYVPERAGEAHKWFKFLEDSWGDDEDYNEKVMALQEAIAATMFGNATQFHRAILLHGKAGTGKSQVLKVIEAMMPPAAVCSIPPQIWNDRFTLADMVGKTLNVCGELPEAATIDGRVFKEVVEGTRQRSEFKGRDAFYLTPTAAQWFASNFLPNSYDTSEGFVRRWLILDFNRKVPKEDRILEFHSTLVAEEREAIAAWAVQGLKRLMSQRDYTQPASHVRKLREVRRSNNSVDAWLQTAPKVSVTNVKEDFADARECFDIYVLHMREVSRGFNVTFERFKQMLNDLEHEVVEYLDPAGCTSFKVRGLKMVLANLSDKWK